MVAGVGLRFAAAIRRLRAAPPLSSARGKQSTGLFASRSRLLKLQVPPHIIKENHLSVILFFMYLYVSCR